MIHHSLDLFPNHNSTIPWFSQGHRGYFNPCPPFLTSYAPDRVKLIPGKVVHISTGLIHIYDNSLSTSSKYLKWYIYIYIWYIYIYDIIYIWYIYIYISWFNGWLKKSPGGDFPILFSMVHSQVAGAMRISVSWALEVWPTWHWPYHVCLAWRAKTPMPNSSMEDLRVESWWVLWLL